jgi:hypothetical protein
MPAGAPAQVLDEDTLHHLVPSAEAQLLVDTLQVEPHSAQRQVELLGDVSVLQVVEQPVDDLGLPRGQAERRRDGRPLLRVEQRPINWCPRAPPAERLLRLSDDADSERLWSADSVPRCAFCAPPACGSIASWPEARPGLQ